MASSCSSSAFHSAAQSSPSPPFGGVAADSTSPNQSPPNDFSPSPRVKICEVYLGFSGRGPLLRRFVKWLRAELETQGVRCFASDRRWCRDAYAHGTARTAMDAAAVGVVVITNKSFSNPYSVEEMRWFLERKNLVPVFFGLTRADCTPRDMIEKRGEVWERSGGRLWMAYGGIEAEWQEAVNGVSLSSVKLEVNTDNFRDRILDAVCLLGTKLGRRSMVDNVTRWRELAKEELPFPQNENFVGRKSELAKLELMLFGDIEANPEDYIEIRTHNARRRYIDMARNGSSSSNGTTKGRAVKKHEDIKSKGKEPVVWKESEGEIEMQGNWSSDWPFSHIRKNGAPSLSFRQGVACVCGDSGIGKTELLLEFAYRFSQRYKKVLWVGGESRYLRQNYLNLLPLLGVDVTIESEIFSQRNGPRSFEEMEADAIGKVRRELMRDIPFLLVIDNLESEKDWWDGRNIMELLPRFGGDTHIIISSCLPQILNIRPLRLSYFSSAEAMILMKGKKTDLPAENISSLSKIEEKVGRVPLGLAIVGAILSELPIAPHELLETMKQMPYRELKLNRKEDYVLKHNPGLIQLLDVCFSRLDSAQKTSKLARKIVEVSNWFAPSPIPISMLAIAASASSTRHHRTRFWKRCLQIFPCTFVESDVSNSGDEASFNLESLVRFSLARKSTKEGYISFHRIIKLYGFERDNVGSNLLITEVIQKEGSLQLHANHIWSACFFLFKFGLDPGVINLSTRNLLSFIRCFVLPLASITFTNFYRCNAALELLRLSNEALEALESSFLAEVTSAQNKTMCLKNPRTHSSIESYQLLYHDLLSLRSIVLELRAKFMLQGGQYKIAEQLYKTVVSIKEDIYGNEHPQTQATREATERILYLQSKYGSVD
ncbi:hypothetical protein Cni_G07206 [Canna indica]|uniref:TIR domain-containing protein n=1 Tax=Canna indica TaxID=4628 RepID=A0AAQ3JY29_9LILI|nr:hypothetical protein Cni_G07206 [Canna indica]